MAHTIEGERLLLVIVLPGTIFKMNKIVHEVMAQNFVNVFTHEEAADVFQQLKAYAGVLGGRMSIKDPTQGQTRPSRPFPANGMSDSEQGQCTFVLAHRKPRNIRERWLAREMADISPVVPGPGGDWRDERRGQHRDHPGPAGNNDVSRLAALKHDRNGAIGKHRGQAHRASESFWAEDLLVSVLIARDRDAAAVGATGAQEGDKLLGNRGTKNQLPVVEQQGG